MKFSTFLNIQEMFQSMNRSGIHICTYIPQNVMCLIQLYRSQIISTYWNDIVRIKLHQPLMIFEYGRLYIVICPQACIRMFKTYMK